MRIALFVTCVTDTLFPEAGKATVAVLERLGHTVVFPEEQTCCGQMHGNSGYEPEALGLVRRFTRVFGDPAFDAVVAPSGSCVAMVRHHYGRLAQSPTTRAATRCGSCASAEAPLRLLRNVRGIDLVALPEAEGCCGFGGTFALKNADTSAAMLTDKLRAILDTGAEVCTALDSSCLLHIGGGLSRQRAGVRTAHLSDILASVPDRT